MLPSTCCIAFSVLLIINSSPYYVFNTIQSKPNIYVCSDVRLNDNVLLNITSSRNHRVNVSPFHRHFSNHYELNELLTMVQLKWFQKTQQVTPPHHWSKVPWGNSYTIVEMHLVAPLLKVPNAEPSTIVRLNVIVTSVRTSYIQSHYQREFQMRNFRPLCD